MINQFQSTANRLPFVGVTYLPPGRLYRFLILLPKPVSGLLHVRILKLLNFLWNSKTFFILFLKWSEEKLLGCYVNFCWFEQVWKPCFKHFVSRLTNSSQTNFHFKSPLKSSFRFIHLKHFDAELGGCRKLTIKFTIFQVSWSSLFYQVKKLVTNKIASPWSHWDRSHFIKEHFR